VEILILVTDRCKTPRAASTSSPDEPGHDEGAIMIAMTTRNATTQHRTTSRARRVAVGSTGVLLVAVLAACGGDDPAAEVGALSPIEVPSASASPSGAPTTAGPSADPSAGPSSSPPVVASSGAPSSGTVVDTEAELEVEDQSGDGTGVRVESVRLSSGSGHVVVQTRDGQVIGSAPVTSGSQPVTIPLDPRVTGSGELLAVLHADDGDGAFDATRDAVVVDDDGERESEDFDYRLR
jgi:hypothetical protein